MPIAQPQRRVILSIIEILSGPVIEAIVISIKSEVVKLRCLANTEEELYGLQGARKSRNKKIINIRRPKIPYLTKIIK